MVSDWVLFVLLVWLLVLIVFVCDKGEVWCMLVGRNLFLLVSVVGDVVFIGVVSVLDGFIGSSLLVFWLLGGMLFLKLCDSDMLVVMVVIFKF